MLNVMAEILPIDAKEWGQVMERTQEKTGIERTAPSLKRKFQTLHRKKIQTGNSNMPEEVLAAKRIFHKIRRRALGLSGGANSSLEDEILLTKGANEETADEEKADEEKNNEDTDSDEDSIRLLLPSAQNKTSSTNGTSTPTTTTRTPEEATKSEALL